MQALTLEDLTAKTAEFRRRLSRGATLNDLLPEAFAVVREVSSRVLRLRHYDVQMVRPSCEGFAGLREHLLRSQSGGATSAAQRSADVLRLQSLTKAWRPYADQPVALCSAAGPGRHDSVLHSAAQSALLQHQHLPLGGVLRPPW